MVLTEGTAGTLTEREKTPMTGVILSKRFFILLATIIPILGLPVFGQTVTYYVSGASGDDISIGTSREAPLRTVAKARERAVAGDTVRVLKGTYDKRIYITRSGAPGQPIVYEAEPGVVCVGFTVKASYIYIVGFEITDTVNDWVDGAGVHVVGRYNEIRANYIHDVTRIGIHVEAPTRDTPEVQGCVVRQNRIIRAGLAGVSVSGRNHIVEGNEISHILQHPPKWTNPPSWVDADGIWFFGSGHIIRKNKVYDITLGDPENINPHIDCFQTYGPAYNIIFEQNFCHLPDQYMQGFMIEQINPPVGNIMIRNNVIKAFTPLNIWDCPGTSILNNTFKPELSYRGDSNYGAMLQRSPNSKIKNNLFYDVGRHSYPYLYMDSVSSEGTEVGYNCHYMSDGKPPAGKPRANDLWQVDPKLVNVSGNDFRLQAGSPLIDKGTMLVDVKDDFDGMARPQGLTHDIGAFEYTGVSKPRNPPTNLRIVQ
jgi:hypothetical protein